MQEKHKNGYILTSCDDVLSAASITQSVLVSFLVFLKDAITSIGTERTRGKSVYVKKNANSIHQYSVMNMLNIACDQYVVMNIKGQFKRSERHVVDLENAHGQHCKPLTIRAKFYLEEHNLRSQLMF